MIRKRTRAKIITSGSDNLPAVLRRWAAEQIGVDEDAGAEHIQAAFLARLRETNFSPPPAWNCALSLLQHGLPDVWRADHDPARRNWEQSLREKVEAFAARFFSLDLEPRSRRWRELLAECEPYSPRLAARLQALEPGLQIDAAVIPREGSPVGDLARDAMRLFVLRQAERAAARQVLIVEQQRDANRWHEAASSLAFRYPRLASLEPALVDYWKQSEQREGRRDELHRRLRNRRRPVVKSSRGNDRNSFPLFTIAMFVLFLLVQLIRSYGNVRPAPPAPPNVEINPDAFSDPKVRELFKRFNAQQTTGARRSQ